MTTSPHNPHDHLPPDLRDLAAALDRLAAAERAACPEAMLPRVAGEASVSRLAQSMQMLAEADRLSAPPALEDGVFDLSRQELPGAPRVAPMRLRVVTSTAWALRAAAAIAVIGSVALVIISTRPSTPAVQPIAAREPDPAEAEEAVLAMMAMIDDATMQRQMDELLSDAEGLSPSTVKPELPASLLEGAM